jgi:mannopine transport system substrate-binding protein
MRGLWIALLCLASAAPPAQAQQKPVELVIVASGGSFEKALRKNFYDPFTEATGIRVRAVAASYGEQWAKARAMAQSGRADWDIVTVGIGEEAANRPLLQKLDCAALPNMATQAIPGTCRDYTVLRTMGGTVLAYNTDVFMKEKAPRGWKDFWDAKAFPGGRAIPNYGAPYIPMAVALVADGVAVDDVRKGTFDIDRALKKLDQIKPQVVTWWKTGDQSQQSFRNGEVALSMMWSGRALELKKAGVPIEVAWEGASAEMSAWGVLKSSPNREAALKFLDFFVTRAESHRAFSAEMFWDTVNRDALQQTYGSVDRFLERVRTMVVYDADWLAANRETITTRWNEWISR